MARKRSNPIEVIIDYSGDLGKIKSTNIKRLQSKHYAEKTTEAYKNTKDNFRYFVFPNNDILGIDKDAEFATMAELAKVEKILSRFSDSKYITLLIANTGDHNESRMEGLRQSTTRRGIVESSAGPLTMLHDVVECLLRTTGTGKPPTMDSLRYHSNFGFSYASVALCIVDVFSVVERSSIEVRNVVEALLMEVKKIGAEGNIQLTENKRLAHRINREALEAYASFGVNSLASRKGFSAGEESIKDAIALTQLTPRSRPIFLPPDELSNESISMMARRFYNEVYHKDDYDSSDYRDAVKLLKARIKDIDAKRLSECFRDIFDILFPFMYGAVFSINYGFYSYVPPDLPDIDLK